MKRCAHCKRARPIEEFPRDSRQRDGRFYYCHSCLARDPKKKTHNPARSSAIGDLIARHRAEFDDLVAEHQERLQTEALPL